MNFVRLRIITKILKSQTRRLYKSTVDKPPVTKGITTTGQSPVQRQPSLRGRETRPHGQKGIPLTKLLMSVTLLKTQKFTYPKITFYLTYGEVQPLEDWTRTSLNLSLLPSSRPSVVEGGQLKGLLRFMG